jgi:hypothetical protein
MKNALWAIAALVVVILMIGSWMYTSDTVEMCMEKGNSRIYCMMTYKLQNAKRMLGIL